MSGQLDKRHQKQLDQGDALGSWLRQPLGALYLLKLAEQCLTSDNVRAGVDTDGLARDLGGIRRTLQSFAKEVA